MESIGRRDFLRLAGGALLGMVAQGANGSGTVRPDTRPGAANSSYDSNASAEPTDLDEYDFVLPRVRVVELAFKGRGKGPDVWNVRPGGDANLLRELARIVRCHVKPIVGAMDWQPQYAYDGQLNAAVTFDDPGLLRHYPFLFMTGENHFELNSDQKGNLKDFLTAGGFLLMDDCVVGSGGDFFYASSTAGGAVRAGLRQGDPPRPRGLPQPLRPGGRWASTSAIRRRTWYARPESRGPRIVSGGPPGRLPQFQRPPLRLVRQPRRRVGARGIPQDHSDGDHHHPVCDDALISPLRLTSQEA